MEQKSPLDKLAEDRMDLLLANKCWPKDLELILEPLFIENQKIRYKWRYRMLESPVYNKTPLTIGLSCE